MRADYLLATAVHPSWAVDKECVVPSSWAVIEGADDSIVFPTVTECATSWRWTTLLAASTSMAELKSKWTRQNERRSGDSVITARAAALTRGVEW